jgi:hypothetical protein
MTRRWRGAYRLTALAAAGALALGVAGLLRAQTSSPGGASIDRRSFRYQRRIPAGEPGVATLRLDLAAVTHSRIADLRIVTSEGFQVPYLLEGDPSPLRVDLPVPSPVTDPEAANDVSQRGGRHRSVYALALPLKSMPACSLHLETRERVFEREVSVLAKEEDARKRDAGRWQTRAWGTWRHTDPDSPAAPLVLDLPSVATTDARLVVDEGDNRPLPLDRAWLDMRTARLRFVREGSQELRLMYGRADLGPPRYDLALIEPRLRAENAVEVTAEPETDVEGPATDRATTIFWAALIAAVVVLVIVLARLLRLKDGEVGGPGSA